MGLYRRVLVFSGWAQDQSPAVPPHIGSTPSGRDPLQPLQALSALRRTGLAPEGTALEKLPADEEIFLGKAMEVSHYVQPI